MDKILVFLDYLFNSISTILLAIALFGLYDKLKNGIFVGLIGGIADYIVKELIVPYLGLFAGFHFITSLLVLTLACYYILDLKLGVALGSAVLSHILSAISELIIVVILLLIFGQQFVGGLEDSTSRLFIVGLIIQIPLIVSLIFVVKHKFSLIRTKITS